MQQVIMAVLLVGLFIPGVVRAESDDWDNLEQELNVQLDQLDVDLKVMDEQLNLEVGAEATTEAVFVQQDGKMVQVMSEKAVTVSLIAQGVISWTDAKKEALAINLTEEDGVAVYEVSGILQQKLLGIWPVEIEKKVIVKAETAAVIRQEMSLGTRILDLVAF